MVEPPQSESVYVDVGPFGANSEVVLARTVAHGRAVHPWANYEPGAASNPLVATEPARFGVVAQCSAQEDVIPAADVEGRRFDVRVVILDAPLVPVVVVVRMLQPVEVILDQVRPGEARHLVERKMSELFVKAVYRVEVCLPQ